MSTEAELWVVDRFEGDVAVLVSDRGETLEVERALLPPDSRVGVVLRVPYGRDGAPVWSESSADQQATDERHAEAERILDELRKRDPGGDVAL